MDSFFPPLMKEEFARSIHQRHLYSRAIWDTKQPDKVQLTPKVELKLEDYKKWVNCVMELKSLCYFGGHTHLTVKCMNMDLRCNGFRTWSSPWNLCLFPLTHLILWWPSNHESISLLLQNCNCATVRNCSINIWSAGYPNIWPPSGSLSVHWLRSTALLDHLFVD